VRAVSKKNTRPESIVDIARLFHDKNGQLISNEQTNAIANTYLDIFQHREHKQIKLRVPPPDYHAWG
jgi:hypothetical protein